MNTQPPILHRAATSQDVPLIYSDWLRSYRRSPLTKHVPSAVYYSQHRALIDNLASRSRVVVLCNPDDTNQVYGWMCFELTPDVLILHYLYVKEDFRGFGLAKALVQQYLPKAVEDSIIICSHTGPCFQALKDKYHLIYNPYLLARKA